MPGLRQPGGHREVIALTASVTLTNHDIGKRFTNRGASGAVTVTLPTPDAVNAGGEIVFGVVADQNFIVTTSDKLVLINDAAADSIAAQTSSEKIGAVFAVWSDGTSWFAENRSVGANTITTTT